MISNWSWQGNENVSKICLSTKDAKLVEGRTDMCTKRKEKMGELTLASQMLCR